MKITIVGGGNIGGAIARGLASGKVINASDITVCDPSKEALKSIENFNPGIVTSTDGPSAINGADLVIIAVKPWLLEEVLASLRPYLDYAKQSVASVVAGVDFIKLRAMLDNGKGVEPVMYRIIPNTAISIGQSVTFIANEGASQEELAMLDKMFSELGSVFMVTEDMMTAGTSLASCGIAFALKYMDASMAGGMELGFSQADSRAIVMQTVKGALMMLENNNTMPQTEIDKVTTPGGVTLKGLEAMKDAGFSEAVLEGLHKSR